MATALISAFTERKICKEVGMTGEITLRGRVLPVGGIREKVLAAHRSGLKIIILPEKNQKDLIDVPEKVLKGLKIVPVSHLDQVLEVALHEQGATPSRFQEIKKRIKNDKEAKTE